MASQISKKRFLIKRAIDNTLGKSMFNLFSLRKKRAIPKKINKIIFFKLSAIGDSLLVLPFLKSLKDQAQTEIVGVHSEDNKDVFFGHDFIDKTILLNVSGKSPFALLKSLVKIKKEKADVIVDLSQTGNFPAVWAYMTSKFCIGFFNENLPSRNGLYDSEFPLNNRKHMVLNYLGLLSLFGLKHSKKNLGLIKLNFDKKVEKRIEDVLKNKSNLVGIHPCHEIPEKNWSKKNFAKVIDYLVEMGKTPVILGSPKEVRQVQKLLELVKNKKKILDLSGKLSITETIYLMDHLDFFVSNDGGLMHIAASFDMPTLGIFSAETPKKYAPFNKKSFAIDSRRISEEESLKTAKKVIDIFLNKHL